MSAVPPEPLSPERRPDIPDDESDGTDQSDGTDRSASTGEPVRPAPELEPPVDGARLEVSGTQVAASVLASVSAAVVASYFSLAGTIVGAAVMSLVATVGSAAYGLGIRRTKSRLYQLQALRLVQASTLRRAGDQAGPTATGTSARTATGGPAGDTTRPMATGGTPTDTVAAGSRTDATRALGAEVASPRVPSAGTEGWRGWLAERRWGVAAGVALVFVISLLSVTLIELIGDRALSRASSGSARTSVGALLTGDDGGDQDGDDGGDTDEGDRDAPSVTAPSETTTTSAPDDDRTASTTTTAPDDGTGEQAPTTSTSTTSTTSTSAPPATTTTTVPVPAPAVPTTAPTAPAG